MITQVEKFVNSMGPVEHIQNLEKVVGRIPDHLKHDFVHNQSRVFGDLTELLMSRATPVVTAQVTGLLEKTYVSPYTKFLLPIRQLGPYESINVKWTEVNFDPGFAEQTEVLGVGRYFTHNKSRRGATAVRRQAAVKIESGFFMTPEGREDWRNQIEQLVTIVQNTNEYDVMLTLLQTPIRHHLSARDMNGPVNRVYGVSYDMTFKERLFLERDMFGIINKTPDSRGFQSLVTNLRTVMSRNGVTPDAIVVPPYLLGYYHISKPDLWEYSSAGPANAQNREMATDIGGNSAFRTGDIQGMRIVDTYIYRPVKTSRESVVDLLTVPKQIGEFYPMEIESVYRDGKSFEMFTASSRNVRIFNEDHSRITTVDFGNALQHTFRFDETSGELLSDKHDNLKDDMFVNEGDVCELFGDMKQEYLSTSTMNDVIQTLVNVCVPDEADLKVLNGTSVANMNKDYLSKLKGLLDKYKDVISKDVMVGTFNKLLVESPNIDPGLFKTTKGASEWAKYLSFKKPVQRLLGWAFLNTKINMKVMVAMHRNDIFVPVNIILARPHMTYNVSSVIMMKAGVETGETIIGQQDFQMSSNTQDRTLEASYVYYGKAIVKKSRNVVVAPSVFIQSYIRGNNTEFIDNSALGEIQQSGAVFESSKSILALMVPIGGEYMQRNYIDIRGTNDNEPDVKYHASADYYNSLLSINPSDIASPTEDFVDYAGMTYQPNTICFLGHVEYGHDQEHINRNTGHLGPETYDQVNHSRREGMFTPVKQMNYHGKFMN